MSETAALKIKIGVDLVKLDEKVKTLQDAFANYGANLRSVGQSLSASITAPLTQVAGSAIKVGIEVEALKRRFRATFGDAADEVEDWADAVARATGRSKYDVMGYAETLQKSFEPLGFAQEQATDMGKTVAQLAVDLASFNGATEPEMIELLTAAMEGSGEAAAQLGVDLSDATVNQELLNAGVAGGLKGASEQQKVLARLSAVLDGTATAQGHASKAAGTYEGQMAALDGALKNAGAAIYEVLGPALAVVVGIVQKAVAWFSGLGETSRFIIVLFGGVAAAVGPILAGLGLLAGAVAVLKTSVSTLGITMKGVLISSGVGLALTALGAAAYYVIDNWEEVKAWFIVAFQNIKMTIVDSLDFILKGVQSVAGLLSDDMAASIGTVRDSLQEMKESGKQALDQLSDEQANRKAKEQLEQQGGAADDVTKAYAEMQVTIEGMMKSAGQSATDASDRVGDASASMDESIGQVTSSQAELNEELQAANENAKTWAVEGLTPLGGTLSDVDAKLTDMNGEVKISSDRLAEVGTTLEDVNTRLADVQGPRTFRDAWGEAVGRVNNSVRALKRGGFDEFADGIGGLAKQAKSDIGENLTSLFAVAGPWGKALSGGLKIAQMFGLDVNKIMGKVAGFVKGAFSSIGGFVKKLFGGKDAEDALAKAISSLKGVKNKEANQYNDALRALAAGGDVVGIVKFLFDQSGEGGLTSDELNPIFQALGLGSFKSGTDLKRTTSADEIMRRFEASREQALGVFAGIQQELEAIARKESILGDAFDDVGERIRVLESGLMSLIEAGIDPASEQFRKVQQQLAGAKAEAARLEAEEKRLREEREAAERALRERREAEERAREEEERARARVAEAFADIEEGLAEIDRHAAIFGTTSNTAADKVRVLENGLESLLDVGIDPASAEFRSLQDQLERLRREAALFERREEVQDVLGQLRTDLGVAFHKERLFRDDFDYDAERAQLFAQAIDALLDLGLSSFSSTVLSLKRGEIPTLADGGIAMPRAGGLLARIAEAGVPEAIIPLNRLPQMLGGIAGMAGGGGFAQTVNVYLDERLLGRATARRLVEELNLHGVGI